MDRTYRRILGKQIAGSPALAIFMSEHLAAAAAGHDVAGTWAPGRVIPR